MSIRDAYPTVADDPQRAGQDVTILQEGRIIAYGTNFTVDYDNAIQRLNAIGFHGAIALKSTDLQVRASLGTMMIVAENDPGAIQETGWQTDSTNNINYGGYTSFTWMDIDSSVVVLTLIDGKPSSGQYTNPAVGMLEKSINFEFKRMASGIYVSG